MIKRIRVVTGTRAEYSLLKPVMKAIKKALYDEDFKEKVRSCKNPYGDGKAGVRIADILSKVKIDRRLLQKKMTY